MNKYLKLSKYWGIEFSSVIWNTNNTINFLIFNIHWSKGDHQGLYFTFILFNWCTDLFIYDSRHSIN